MHTTSKYRVSRVVVGGSVCAFSIAAFGAVVVAGCGGGPAEQRMVRGVAMEYFQSLSAGNGRRACALLTDEARQREYGDGERCEVTVRDHARQSDPSTGVRDVRINGDLATAIAEFGTAKPRNVVLGKNRGTWKIRDPSVEVPGGGGPPGR